MSRQRGPDPTEVVVVPPRAPRRYAPPPAEHHPGARPLPSIYGRHRILAFWYVPAAVLLAIAVAVGVVWAGEHFFGSDGSPQAIVATPSAAASPSATQPPPSSTASATSTTPTTLTPTPTPAAAGKFKVGDVVIVTGTGDCLNIRVAPGRDNDAIVCLQDGNSVTITGGPETAGDLRWWKVKTQLGEGWAAEDYLVKK